MSQSLQEIIARAMRSAYAEYDGVSDLTPWDKSSTKEAWMHCAKAALGVLALPVEETEE